MSDFWQETISSAQQLRRWLHTYPELSWQEQKTAERIRKHLNELNIEWRPCAKTGTVAVLNASASGKSIALRGDIDALPIHEDTGQSWSSLNAGCMHACGHDGHTATLTATASWLKEHETDLSGPVTLIVQPAEEGGHGAKHMIEEGALEGVDEIYGWHNWPAISFGKILCPDGLVMCGNGTFEIVVKGKGGHASQPEQCADPVLAASAITVGLQQIVARRIAPQDFVVVSVTSIEAQSGLTIIPERASMSGSIRVPNSELKERVAQLIAEVSSNIAQAYGVEAEVTFTSRYDPTINHPSAAQNFRRVWQQLWGEHSLADDARQPVMASEDFSYYLQHIPGAFALIGADDGPAHQHSCHSPHYDFNDRLIERVVSAYSRLVGINTP